jgi:hypothetical protein
VQEWNPFDITLIHFQAVLGGRFGFYILTYDIFLIASITSKFGLSLRFTTNSYKNLTSAGFFLLQWICCIC